MISVVVPIFNEEENLLQFHQAVAAAMEKADEDWEVVYVNDGSRDSSFDLMLRLQADDPHVVVVDLSRNWGHMGAISAGLTTARGAAVIIMDGDFQDPPEVIPQLVNSWREGAQVVVAVRRSRQERRKLLAKLFPLFYRILSAVSDYPIPLDAGIFGLLDRQAVDSINALQEGNRYLPGLRAWVGYRNAVVLYDRQDRAAGDGKLTFISRIKYATDAITSFSYKPLRLCLLLSCISSFAAVVLIISTILSKVPVDSIGFGVAAAIFLVGALLLLCLGILGEYLGRVYDEVRRRPLSIINKVYYASEMAPSATGTEFESEPSPRIYRVA
ncbi:MAG: glycosyltransferase family 2 protein [Acidobacteriaceae bacterium]|nr:glycosyltransferase family 2 protein [Acidobacteriaceae bacterium]